MQEDLWYKEEPKTGFAPRERQLSSDSLHSRTQKNAEKFQSHWVKRKL